MRSVGDEVKNATVRPARRWCAAPRQEGGGGKNDCFLTNHRHIVCIPSECKFCGNVNTLLVNRNEMMNECITKLLFTIAVQWECYKLGMGLNFCL